LLAGPPGRPNGLPDSEAIAARLVALLPGRADIQAAVRVRTNDAPRALDPKVVALSFGFVLIMLLASVLFTSTGRTPASAGATPAAASRTPLLAISQQTR
jgi:hypothetical protein